MTVEQPRRRSYGRAKGGGQHIIQSCVRPDVWAVIQRLQADHGLTISGASHHLMRLGAGLKPLFPFSEVNSND